MPKKKSKNQLRPRRIDADEFKHEAVQMLLDGHSAVSECERLGLSGTNLLYRWKNNVLRRKGGIASNREGRVRGMEAELRRVERERDILKKAWSNFGRSG